MRYSQGVHGERAKGFFASNRQHVVRILSIWALALLAYSNSFQGSLVFDNTSMIARDPRIREATISNVRLILTQGYWYGRGERLYRPLTTLSYLFQYAVLGNGPNPTLYHWINFLLHAVNIALVYVLLLWLLERPGPALAAAALWAVHPILTEAVTNIVGRADLLGAFGVLAGLLCHIQAARSGPPYRVRWLAALAMVTAVGVFSKETGVVLLGVMVAYDLTFVSGPKWRGRAAGYLAAGVPMAVYFAARWWIFSGTPVDPQPFLDNPLVGADFWTARLTAIETVGRIPLLVVWPQRLSCDYSFNQIPLFHWGDWTVFPAAAGCIAALTAAVLWRRRASLISFAIAFFFITLAPACNLVIVIGSILADRFQYLPALAIVMLAVFGWVRLSSRFAPMARSGTALLALICTVLAARTWARNGDWLNNTTLWSSAVEAAPGSYKTHANLAAILIERPENLAAARGEADRALAILDPLPDERNVAQPYATAAQGDRMEGDAAASPEARAAWYGKALDLLLRARRIDAAWSGHLAHGFGTDSVYVELSRIYQRLGDPTKAREALEYGRRIVPESELCEELAGLYAASGDLERGAVTYMEALSLDPERTSTAGKLMELYRKLDPQGCSLANGALNLGCPMVHGHLCTSARNIAGLYRGMHNDLPAETVESQAVRTFGCPSDLFGNR